jgi:hypothetical protein
MSQQNLHRTPIHIAHASYIDVFMHQPPGSHINYSLPAWSRSSLFSDRNKAIVHDSMYGTYRTSAESPAWNRMKERSKQFNVRFAVLSCYFQSQVITRRNLTPGKPTLAKGPVESALGITPRVRERICDEEKTIEKCKDIPATSHIMRGPQSWPRDRLFLLLLVTFVIAVIVILVVVSIVIFFAFAFVVLAFFLGNRRRRPWKRPISPPQGPEMMPQSTF